MKKKNILLNTILYLKKLDLLTDANPMLKEKLSKKTNDTKSIDQIDRDLQELQEKELLQ